MRASQFHLFTLKEAPSDAEVVSQQLMLRAGMIRKVAAGIYNYMPMGLRSIRKIEAIIRDELDRAGLTDPTRPDTTLCDRFWAEKSLCSNNDFLEI